MLMKFLNASLCKHTNITLFSMKKGEFFNSSQTVDKLLNFGNRSLSKVYLLISLNLDVTFRSGGSLSVGLALSRFGLQPAGSQTVSLIPQEHSCGISFCGIAQKKILLYDANIETNQHSVRRRIYYE